MANKTIEQLTNGTALKVTDRLPIASDNGTGFITQNVTGSMVKELTDQSLEEVLAKGNETGASNLVVSDGRTIRSVTGTSFISLQNSADQEDKLKLSSQYDGKTAGMVIGSDDTSGAVILSVSDTDGERAVADITDTTIELRKSDPATGDASSYMQLENAVMLSFNARQALSIRRSPARALADVVLQEKTAYVVPDGISTTDDVPATLLVLPLASMAAQVIRMKATVYGMKDDGSAAICAELSAAFRTHSGSIFQIGTTTVTVQSELTSASADFVLSGPSVQVQVTGEAATAIDWSGQTEISYS